MWLCCCRSDEAAHANCPGPLMHSNSFFTLSTDYKQPGLHSQRWTWKFNKNIKSIWTRKTLSPRSLLRNFCKFMQSEFQSIFFILSCTLVRDFAIEWTVFCLQLSTHRILFHCFSNISFIFSFPETAAKPYATAHTSKSFLTAEKHPASSPTLALVHPPKINHLLKANSFVPCLGTLVSHLDDKD